MAECGHCKKSVGGIRNHIRDKHGFEYYCLAPDLHQYFGKNDPPYLQTDNWPDEPKIKEE